MGNLCGCGGGSKKEEEDESPQEQTLEQTITRKTTTTTTTGEKGSKKSKQITTKPNTKLIQSNKNSLNNYNTLQSKPQQQQQPSLYPKQQTTHRTQTPPSPPPSPSPLPSPSRSPSRSPSPSPSPSRSPSPRQQPTVTLAEPNTMPPLYAQPYTPYTPYPQYQQYPNMAYHPQYHHPMTMGHGYAPMHPNMAYQQQQHPMSSVAHTAIAYSPAVNALATNYAYSQQQQHHAYPSHVPPNTVVHPDGFEAGSRFDPAIARPSIPPPPPGYPPNLAQVASAKGQNTVVGKKKESWLTGGSGGGFTGY